MFELKKTEGKARRGEFTCAHGTVQTPVFMNVGTQGAIKGALSAEDLKNIGCQVELSNTYHLHLRPGDQIVKQKPQHGGGQRCQKHLAPKRKSLPLFLLCFLAPKGVQLPPKQHRDRKDRAQLDHDLKQLRRRFVKRHFQHPIQQDQMPR